MALRARDRVLEYTVVLAAVSLAAVFGAVFGVVPETALPRAPAPVIDAIPHINAVISTVAIVTILLGVRAARRQSIDRHRRLMVVSLGLFGLFLGLYLYRITLRGPTEFTGPDAVYRSVYLPTLAVHVALAIVCIPLLYYVVLLALTRPVSAIRDSLHPRVGRIAASLWVVSFLLGNVVYALLYLVY